MAGADNPRERWQRIAIERLGWRIDAAMKHELPADVLKHVDGFTREQVEESAIEVKRRLEAGEPVGDFERAQIKARQNAGAEWMRRLFGGGR